jgi:hypothetical protein
LDLSLSINCLILPFTFLFFDLTVNRSRSGTFSML